MTEKIFLRDAYCREVTARITAKENINGHWQIRLERTIFYPAGGGQPADHGTINDCAVHELAAAADDIIHVLDRDPGQDVVRLEIDFQRRYDHMQQHTAQHLLSQVLLNLFNAPTLSFAIGPEHSSIEIGRQALDEKEIRILESECARLIFANLPVSIFESEDISALHLRKPPKVRGVIRVVEIAGVDQSACGGTHLRSSAEIGLLKIIKTDRVRANVRLYYVAGLRALGDYQQKHEAMARIQHAITLPWTEIPAQVEKLLAEKDGLRRELKKMQRRKLEKEIAASVASSEPLVIREFSGVDSTDMRYFAAALLQRGKQVLAYSQDPQKYIIIGRGLGSFDLRRISTQIFGLLGGKGGGSENLLEGHGQDFFRLPEVIALLRTSLT
jgi:alanyl-tRNA synthetase